MKKASALALILLGPLLVLPVYTLHLVFTKHIISSDFGAAQSVYATDVDGDGDVDVLGAANGGGIAWWQNDGSQNFTGHYIGAGGDGADFVHAADVDGDADVDVLAAAWSWSDGYIAWWQNDPSEDLAPADPITWTQHIIANVWGGTSVYATNVDGDNDVDVLGTAEYDDDITWWENTGIGNSPPADPVTWTQHTIDGSFDGAYWVYATDVDGDDDTDVLGAAREAETVAWWENDASGNSTPADPITWTKHIIDDAFSGWPPSVYATDLDGDEDVDVLSADYGTGSGDGYVIWWENDGSPADGGWTEHAITSDYSGWRSVYAADVDRDGDTDLLGASFGQHIVAWWENDGTPRDGGWTEHILDNEFSNAASVYATDLDGDQASDVLGAAWGASTVAWWENPIRILYQPVVLKNY